MERITIKQARLACNVLNRENGTPLTEFTRHSESGQDGRLIHNVGNFHINNTGSGRYALLQVCNPNGGVRHITSGNARTIYNHIHAMRDGMAAEQRVSLRLTDIEAWAIAALLLKKAGATNNEAERLNNAGHTIAAGMDAAYAAELVELAHKISNYGNGLVVA